METPKLTTELGDMWFFHPIGQGIVFIFEHKVAKLTATCCSTGRPVSIAKREYKTIEEFEEACKEVYLAMIEDNIVSRDLDFYEKTEFVGNTMIEVDFQVLQN